MSCEPNLSENHYRHLEKYTYDINKFNFPEIFKTLYETRDLSRIHLKYKNVKNKENDSSTVLHKQFYKNFDKLESAYINFLKEVIKPIIKDSFYYQVIPCVRFGFPGQKWLSKFHTDDEYNHSKYEMNVNLAITSTYKTCALSIRQEKNSKESVQLEMEPGEFCFIDHINCKHGSPLNETDTTLISLDFRLVPQNLEKYAFNQRLSVNTKQAFTKGKYFSENVL